MISEAALSISADEIPAPPLPAASPHADNPTFFKILQLFQAIDQEVIEANLDQQIDLMNDGKAKVDGLKHVLDRLKVMATYFGGMKDEYAAKEKAINTKIESLHKYIIHSLQTNNFEKFTGNEFTVKLKKNPASCSITGTKKPTVDHKIKYDEFVRTSYEWNLDVIKDALKSGDPLAQEIATLKHGTKVEFSINTEFKKSS